MKVREATDNDTTAATKLVEAAFGQKLEADLVTALKLSNDAVLELVAEVAGDIVGHILFSKLQAPERCIALAPVSVAPESQGKGIGSALIREGLERAGQAGWQAVFVVGEPEYYARFGFDAAPVAKFECVYPEPYFMVRELAPGALQRLEGKVVFAAPFEGLE